MSSVESTMAVDCAVLFLHCPVQRTANRRLWIRASAGNQAASQVDSMSAFLHRNTLRNEIGLHPEAINSLFVPCLSVSDQRLHKQTSND